MITSFNAHYQCSKTQFKYLLSSRENNEYLENSMNTPQNSKYEFFNNYAYRKHIIKKYIIP